jgi:hypothetical protein
VKNNITTVRFAALATLIALIVSNVSCMTTYDVDGRPMQTVDPAVAVAGIAAAGLIGYAAGNHRGGGHHGHYHGGYYGPCY